MYILKKYFNKDLLKNISTLVIGTGLAQLIAIGFQLITRRLFSPEVFGNYAVYLSLFSILATFSSLQYNRTVLLPKDEKESINLVGVNILVIFLINLIIFLFILIFENKIAELLNINVAYSFWLIFLPFSVLFFSIYEVLNFWLLRQKAFRASAGTKVVRRSGEGVLQSFFGLNGIPSGLIIGDVAGHFLNFLYVGYQSFRKSLVFSKVSFVSMQEIAKRYADFPKYNSIPALLNKLCLFLPVILVNTFYNSEITGYFDLSRIVLALPLALISQAIMQSLLQKISEIKKNRKSIRKELAGLLFILFSLAIVGTIIILFFGEFIFSLFGHEWEKSAIFAQIMVFSFALKFVVSPFSAVFTAFEKIHIASIWQIFNFLVLASLFFFGNLSVYSFVKLYVILEVITYSIYLILIYWVVQKYERTFYA
jgi:O-antigen/teichoic acid export membrane protein